MKSKNISGFTLIEILVVVVIISILSVMGVQMISSGSVERNLKQHGRVLQASIEYSCDQATLQNIPYGIHIFTKGYAFSQFIDQQWVDLISEEILVSKEIIDGSLFSLEIEGHSVVLKDEIDEIPQIMCDSTGQLIAFEIHISDATNTHKYQLKTIDFWNLQGQWLNVSKN